MTGSRSLSQFWILVGAFTGWVSVFAGCATWKPESLNRPLPLAGANGGRSVSPPGYRPGGSDENLPARNMTDRIPETGGHLTEGHSVHQGNAASVKSPPTSLSHSTNNSLASWNEFQLREWPDSKYWEGIYDEINRADSRRVTQGRVTDGAPLRPLSPKTRQVKVEPQNSWDTMLSLMKLAQQNQALDPRASNSESPQTSPDTTGESPKATENSTSANDNATAGGAQVSITFEPIPLSPSPVPAPAAANSDQALSSGVVPPELATAPKQATQLSSLPEKADSSHAPEPLNVDPNVHPAHWEASRRDPGTATRSQAGATSSSEKTLTAGTPVSALAIDSVLAASAASWLVDSCVEETPLSSETNSRQPTQPWDRIQNLQRLWQQHRPRDSADTNPEVRQRHAQWNAVQQLLRRLAELTSPEWEVHLQSPYWQQHLAMLESAISQSEPPQLLWEDKRLWAQVAEAEQQLQGMAKLQLKRATFCYEVMGFGQYREVPSARFQSGQEVLIYCELENFASHLIHKDGLDQHVTRLRNNLIVCDAQNRVVQQVDFPAVEDWARSPRQDFFLYAPWRLGELPPGTYRLYLTVNDVTGNKTTTLDPPLEFEVVARPK